MLTSKDEVDDGSPHIVGAIAGEDYEHRHEEGSIPQVYAAHHKYPHPADSAAGSPGGHVQYAFAPAFHTMHLSPLFCRWPADLLGSTQT